MISGKEKEHVHSSLASPAFIPAIPWPFLLFLSPYAGCEPSPHLVPDGLDTHTDLPAAV